MKVAHICVATALFVSGLMWCGAPALAAELEVIYSEKPGHPTAVVPGAKDLAGTPVFTEFKALETLVVSQDGAMWTLKSRNQLGTDLETQLLLGTGLVGSMWAQEGQPVHGGVAGELYDFIASSPTYFNEVGQFCYTARARGGSSAVFQKGIVSDGVTSSIVAQMGDPVTVFADPNGLGDELIGNSMGSFHVMNSGTFGFQDTTIQNIHSSYRPAVFYNFNALIQSEFSPLEGSSWDSLDSNAFWSTPDGSAWIAQGDDLSATTTDDVLAVGSSTARIGTVVLREGSLISGSTVTCTAIFHTKLLPNGDWYSRGDDPADNDWAVLGNGSSFALLAATGDPITTGSAEHWGNAFLAFNGNQAGDWILIGNTDSGDPAADQVIVFNGTDVVAREGDPVDLDGNGSFDDDAYIGRGNNTLSAFNPDDAYLTDDGVLYFLAPLRDGAGGDLAAFAPGDAFLRINLNAGCPEDLADPIGVEQQDLNAVLNRWGDAECLPAGGSFPCPEDLAAPDGVEQQDLNAVLNRWGDPDCL